MANNYVQFSLLVPLKTKAELSWVAKTLAAITKLFDSPGELDERRARALGPVGRRILKEQWDFADFQFSIEPARDDAEDVAALWIYAEESGNPDQVAALLEAFLQEFRPTGVITFAWAYTCSKLRERVRRWRRRRDRRWHQVHRHDVLGRRPRGEVREHRAGVLAVTQPGAHLEIAQVLVLSTGHLGAAIATGDDPLMNTVASMTGDHGWLVYTGPAHVPVVANEPAALQVLRDILHFARHRGCTYVLFDSDGPTLPKFPLYDW